MNRALINKRICKVLREFDFTQENGNQDELLRIVWDIMYSHEENFSRTRFSREVQNIDVLDTLTCTIYEMKNENKDLRSLESHAQGQKVDAFQQAFSYASKATSICNNPFPRFVITNKNEWYLFDSDQRTLLASFYLDGRNFDKGEDAVNFFDKAFIGPSYEYSVQNMNNDLHRMKDGRAYDLGQNFTPYKKCADLCNKSFMNDFEARFNTATPQELVAFRHEACTIRVFDPACGVGSILCTAAFLLRKFVARIDVVLSGHDLDYDVDEEVTADQFYGIELDPQMVGKAYTNFEKFVPGVPHIINANSLAINWPDFCPVEGTKLVSNFPFEKEETLKKTLKGIETIRLWRESGTMIRKGTCDAAFFKLCLDYGYDFLAIGCYSTAKAVSGIIGTGRYHWGGDASIVVDEYIKGTMDIVKLSRKPLTNWCECRRVENGNTAKTGTFNNLPSNTWRMGHSLEGFRKVIGNKDVDSDFVFNPTSWTIQARTSKVFRIWAEHMCTCLIPGSGEPQVTITLMNSFPLFQGDDLSVFDSMTDDEIFQELLSRYNKLTNK